jgi:hypothetical protein
MQAIVAGARAVNVESQVRTEGVGEFLDVDEDADESSSNEVEGIDGVNDNDLPFYADSMLEEEGDGEEEGGDGEGSREVSESEDFGISDYTAN